MDSNITGSDALFLDLFSTLGLQQHVVEPTFINSGNILDLVLTIDGDRIVDVSSLPPFPHCDYSLIKLCYLFQGIEVVFLQCLGKSYPAT